jgi:pyruvoyl-dependent arginine decarboxylase (PvlArgDC)
MKQQTTVQRIGYVYENGSNFGESDEEDSYSETSVRKMESSKIDYGSSTESMNFNHKINLNSSNSSFSQENQDSSHKY